LTPTNSFLLLGVFTSVPILVKFDQKTHPVFNPIVEDLQSLTRRSDATHYVRGQLGIAASRQPLSKLRSDCQRHYSRQWA